KARPATLQTRLAMLLGEKLPAHVRAELVREVAEDGYRLGHALATQPKDEWYLRDGYWRGPVWAPAVLLAVDGLRACSAGALAKEVSEEFCDMVAKTRFAENFDPISGAPQKDPGYTWTASVFLTLAHELTDEEAWTR
ncbi:MAG: hypothetical protein IJ829_01000, partial [Kiritimatiellae bacterium]|nr:hypothetical protein [Kiritimatiellia bacterium]